MSARDAVAEAIHCERPHGGRTIRAGCVDVEKGKREGKSPRKAPRRAANIGTVRRRREEREGGEGGRVGRRAGGDVGARDPKPRDEDAATGVM